MRPTLKNLQALLPWALGYSEAFEVAKVGGTNAFTDHSTMKHLDFQHALMHVVKATGQLAVMCENADHNRREHQYFTGREVGDGLGNDVPEYSRTDFPEDQVRKYLADLVICALRMAKTRPGGEIDLQRAVIVRLESKNAVQLGFED